MRKLLIRLIVFLRQRHVRRWLYGFLLGYIVTNLLKRQFSPVAVATAVNSDTLKDLPEKVSFYSFLEKIDSKEISKVILRPDDINFNIGEKVFTTTPTTYHPGVADLLYQKSVPFDEVHAVVNSSISWKTIFFMTFPFVYLGCVIYVFKNYLGPDAGNNKTFFGTKKKQRKKKSITFNDVAGVAEAKREVFEITEFYANPEKYSKFGARVPTGILLVGPPGTGKTLLAKALATECNLPFFYCSGSDFVEVFSGRGASRVRNLFKKARNSAPSVIFIDEIDAIGKKRSVDYNFSNNDEREQTLNQLLFCMDGFESDDDFNSSVIVMAATNRFESLDKALTRPGRFDRVVHVGLPNQKGRVEVFIVHTKKLTLHNIDFHKLSELTPGFSGAEIAQICNEAAIKAIRRQSEVVESKDFLHSIYEFRKTRETNKSSTFPDNNVNGLFQQLFQKN